MRVTIIRETNTVVFNAVAFEVDCSALPADVHAIQWDGTRGEIEYSLVHCAHCGGRQKKPNEAFQDFKPYQPYVDGWNAARDAAAEKARAEAEKRRIEAEAQANAAGPQA